jgi:hypothetical protein
MGPLRCIGVASHLLVSCRTGSLRGRRSLRDLYTFLGWCAASGLPLVGGLVRGSGYGCSQGWYPSGIDDSVTAGEALYGEA